MKTRDNAVIAKPVSDDDNEHDNNDPEDDIANETKTTASKQKGTGIPDDKNKCCGFVKDMDVNDFKKNYSNVRISLFGGEAYFEVNEKNIKYVGI